jgi:hypothetical protein
MTTWALQASWPKLRIAHSLTSVADGIGVGWISSQPALVSLWVKSHHRCPIFGEAGEPSPWLVVQSTPQGAQSVRANQVEHHRQSGRELKGLAETSPRQ